jgi:hypothetical protein
MSQLFSIEKIGAVPQHAFIAAVAFLVSLLDPICTATAQYGPALIEDGSWSMELVEHVGDNKGEERVEEGMASSEDMILNLVVREKDDREIVWRSDQGNERAFARMRHS